MTINQIKDYILRFISGVSPRGLLRLDRSEQGIKLPLQNLTAHTLNPTNYHLGNLDADNVWVGDANGNFQSHDLEEVLEELYNMISGGPSPTYYVISNAGEFVIDESDNNLIHETV